MLFFDLRCGRFDFFEGFVYNEYYFDVADHANGATNGNSNGDSQQVPWDDDRDAWWHDEMEDAEASCYPVWMNSEDPLFILYTRYIL